MPRNVPIHPVSVISSTSRAVRTGPTSFWLVPVSTVPAVQVYIFGSVSTPGQHIILPCGAHHIYSQGSQAQPGGQSCSKVAPYKLREYV